MEKKEENMKYRRVSIRAMLVAVLSATPSLFAAPGPEQASASRTVIYLVRHAEPEFPPYASEPPDPRLNPAGRERAEALADMLGQASIERIFSTHFRRALETAKPLADRSGVEIETYDPQSLAELAGRLSALTRGVLVVGHSNATPELVRLLGGDPGDPIQPYREFGRLYVVTNPGNGAATTVRLQYGRPASDYALRLHGVKVKVADMDRALEFYGGILGFQVLSRSSYPRLVSLNNETLPFYLELADRKSPNESSRFARAGIAFQTMNLRSRVAELKKKGVEFITDITKAGVGIAVRFKDPFGNVQILIEQTVVAVEPFVEPRIYNVGFQNPDMAEARAFYSDKLGFVVRSEKYYPPAIPLGHADGSFSHMLHERKGLQIRPDGYPNASQTVLLYRAETFETVLRLLRAIGVETLHETPVQGPLGPFVAIRDPFGVVSEVVQPHKE